MKADIDLMLEFSWIIKDINEIRDKQIIMSRFSAVKIRQIPDDEGSPRDACSRSRILLAGGGGTLKVMFEGEGDGDDDDGKNRTSGD